MDVLLGLSNEYAYFKGRPPQPLRSFHDPWFWAVPDESEDPTKARERIVKAWESRKGSAAYGGEGLHPLEEIKGIGPLTQVKSFTDFGKLRNAFPVHAKKSYKVPDISEELFSNHGLFTAEHDIPYQQRACIDMAAGTYTGLDGKTAPPAWVFDTGGEKTKLKILVYDIETTQFSLGSKKLPPIDMLGWAEFEIAYRASKDIDKEEFHFELVDDPPDWRTVEVHQDIAHNEDEEVKLLLQFCRRVPGYDIISGHNILSFDNREVYDRIQRLLEGNGSARTLSPNENRVFVEFAGQQKQRVPGKWAAQDRTFTFGQQAETVNLHPTSLDTYHAARRFFFFLDDFTLKRLAPFLGVEIPGRVYLSPTDLKLDDPQTALYNKHDVMEQVGCTSRLLAQALPLAFTTGWTFEELLTGGNVRMWDHMGMIRAARARKLAPATVRARGFASTVLNELGSQVSKERIWTHARQRMKDPSQAQRLKEFYRVAKYGPEMPDWAELPHVIVNPKALQQRQEAREEGVDDEDDEEEYLGYSIPGGMTLHPQALGSHFVPWWHVVTADVGAMYPTILRALNVSADTVRLARKGETPDGWVWVYKIVDEFKNDPRWVIRAPGPEESYAQAGQGLMIGIKKNPEPGVTALAMKGVMGIAARVKKQLGDAKKSGKMSKPEIERLQMMYASLKANRNAGTHGQMLAVGVSCRGFNLWAGGEITTVGQRILADVQVTLKQHNARVIYGDSVAGDRSVVVKDPAGRIRVIPIQDLYRLGNSGHPWHGKEAVRMKGWQALSMETDGVAHSPEWRSITRVIQHRTKKMLYRVAQPEGATVCTEDHSIMAERDGVIQRTRPQEMAGANLVRVRCPPNPLKAPIDLVEYLEPLAAELEKQLGPPRRGGKVNPGRRFGFDEEWIWFSTVKKPQKKLRRFIEPGSSECAALCRLLGAYVSEGSVNWGKRQGASIANSDGAWLKRIQVDVNTIFSGLAAGIVESDRRELREIVLKDGTVSLYKDRTLKLQLTNKLAALFFWALGGKGSGGKQVPDFLFNLPSYHQGEFLEMAVAGDGSPVTDPRYTARHRRENFSYTTTSERLAAGLSVLMSQMGYDYGLRRDPKRGFHVLFTRGSKRPGRPVRCEPVSGTGFVYDLEVEGTHTFVDAYGGILLHNTDGLYIGCSKSALNFPETAQTLGLEYSPGPRDSWYILPDEAEEAIQVANKQIREYLNYEAFDLEAEHHDAMVFVVHKNYLIFDVKKGKLELVTKGNNFRGSDKAPIAQKLLAEIMRNALREVADWRSEEDAREALKASIKKWTREVVKGFDITKVDKADLTLVQIVQPANSYKANPDGSPSIWMKRAAALEKLTGERLRASKKYRFVVCKEPLKGIEKPSKTGIKPLDYMWPVDSIPDDSAIDLAWYKDMMEKYIRGAFGFEDLEMHSQRGLDAWM